MFCEQGQARLKLIRQSFGNFDEKLRQSSSPRSVAAHLFGVNSVDFPDYVKQNRATVEVKCELFHGFGRRNLINGKILFFGKGCFTSYDKIFNGQ